MNAHTFPVIMLTLLMTATSFGQRPIHYQFNINMPPGAIGARLIQQNPPFRGYVQPVELRVPPGAEISIGSDGAFQFPSDGSLQVGLTVGNVYRLQVTNIPRNEGGEVFPSVEIINRLYPPAGEKWRFPIPIHIAQEDLEQALAGKMVVRVIYVEDPNAAFPEAEDPQQQRYFDVLPEEDPLQVADELGRPIAIVRLGSRKPGIHGPDDLFLFGSPPVSLMSGWNEQHNEIPFHHIPMMSDEPPLKPIPEPDSSERSGGKSIPPTPEANDPFVDENTQ